jgi:hypothetical protein
LLLTFKFDVYPRVYLHILLLLRLLFHAFHDSITLTHTL